MTDEAHPDNNPQEEEVEVNPLKALTFGKLIDGMYELRTKKQAKEKEAKALGKELEAMEMEIINRLDTDETTMGRGKVATAILTETEVAKVEDWDEFYEYIGENEAYHLLQRRPATPACRETINAGDKIGGVSIFTKRAISLRKIA